MRSKTKDSCVLDNSQAASEWDEALPYELRCLEAALQATGRSLAGEVSAMEQRAIPALTRLMQKVRARPVLHFTHCRMSAICNWGTCLWPRSATMEQRAITALTRL